MSDIVERLNDIWSNDDHARGCQGREYDCTCGFDGRTFSTAKEAADTIEALRARLLAAEKALEPFAKEAAKYDPDEGDGSALAWDSEFLYRELRAARELLSTLRAQGITKPDDGREG